MYHFLIGCTLLNRFQQQVGGASVPEILCHCYNTVKSKGGRNSSVKYKHCLVLYIIIHVKTCHV